jgi:hypothetical protein
MIPVYSTLPLGPIAVMKGRFEAKEGIKRPISGRTVANDAAMTPDDNSPTDQHADVTARYVRSPAGSPSVVTRTIDMADVKPPIPNMPGNVHFYVFGRLSLQLAGIGRKRVMKSVTSVPTAFT